MIDNDLINRAKSIEDTYILYRGRLDSLTRSIKETKTLIERTKNQHESKLHQYSVSEKAVEVIKNVVGEFSKRGVSKLQELLSYAVQNIFPDKKYSIEIEITDRGDLKKAEFWLVEHKPEGEPLKTRLRDSVGGGIQVVTSLVLRIYFIQMLNYRKFLILDEALKEVSTKYVPALFNFLQQTVKELGFTYLWVTHDTRFEEFADKVYRVDDGIVKEER
jgi:DNA repair exonuclease SbcCD ATPase subunit